MTREEAAKELEYDATSMLESTQDEYLSITAKNAIHYGIVAHDIAIRALRKLDELEKWAEEQYNKMESLSRVTTYPPEAPKHFEVAAKVYAHAVKVIRGEMTWPDGKEPK